MAKLSTEILKEFRSFIDVKIKESIRMLEEQDGFYPIMFSATDQNVEAAEIDFNESTKQDCSRMICEHVKNPEIGAISLLYFGEAVVADKDRIICDNISEELDVEQSIFAFIYTPEASYFRRIPVSKGIDGWVISADDGWVEIKNTLEGLFSNPWQYEMNDEQVRKEIDELTGGL
jgi:hypothetical protein